MDIAGVLGSMDPGVAFWTFVNVVVWPLAIYNHIKLKQDERKYGSE